MSALASASPRRVGVLGGTFDPIHNGHLILAETAYRDLALESVIFVPAGQPWRKSARAVSPAHHRLAMVRLALAGRPHFTVSTLEIDGNGPSYTAETLATLQKELGPQVEIFFILGEDALADLPYWYNPQGIIDRAVLAVARRPARNGVNREALERQLPGLSSRLLWLAMPVVEIGATELRQRAARGESLADSVPPAVADYIRREGLYR